MITNFVLNSLFVCLGTLGLGNHWSSFKNLNSVIINATVNKSVDCIYDLENLLKQHKPDFFSLLKQLVSTDRLVCVQF